MADDPTGPPKSAAPWWRRQRAELEARADATRNELREQVKARREDLINQFEATRHQLDATNELIEARTGRNLIAAIAIGLALGLVMLFSLIVIKELFMLLAAAGIAFATFESATAFRSAGLRVPRIASIIAGVAIVPASFYLDDRGKWLTMLAGVVLIAIWRLAELGVRRFRAPARAVLDDIAAGTFIQVYVAFLAGFAVLLTAKENGQWWTLAFIILVVAVDTGAYASGLLFGKHKMAPRISPKKTWEGFGGALLVALLAGVLLAAFMLQQPWWFGLIFGAVIFFTATIGDLTESLIKRDLGIKDMSSWLPGHGGFLDRLDSLLPSAAAAYVLYLVFA